MNSNLTKELTTLFEYIKENICAEYEHAMVNEFAYVLAVLRNENSLAYQALSSTIMESTIEEMKTFYSYQITYTVNDTDDNKNPYTVFDKYIDDCTEFCKQNGMQNITSSMLLLAIVKKHEEISKQFRNFSVTTIQLQNSVKSQSANLTTALVEVPKKHIKKKKTNTSLEVSQPIKMIESTNSNSEIGRNLINISKMASIGQIPQVVRYDKYYDEIFAILSKKNRNNVAICGKSGVGKTATAKHLANIINEKRCHPSFHKKIVCQMDFSKLVCGTFYKGAFEQKFYTMMDEVRKSGDYIFIIDNLHLLLGGNTKYAETDMESLLETLFSEPSLQVVCTMPHKAFKNIETKSILGKYLQEVLIEEPSDEDADAILDSVKSQYETYHDVEYSQDALKSCVELSRKYLQDRCLPDSALDLLDIVGAKANISSEENPKLKSLKSELASVLEEISLIKNSSESKEYDKIDNLIKKQIGLKSEISLVEKEEMFGKQVVVITKNDVCKILSEKIDVPLEDLNKTEKVRLKGLSNKIKADVIGQDEAVDEVCRAVKRQRVGLGESDRPAVLMFLGSTGVGKTYLAKKLAKEVFGDDKYFVRMDMSEYADKTSVSKIAGSSNGYVGYDDETVLQRNLKSKKRFVLLLDEFEKSDELVHNIFLQMFDDGRFTDNHGETYSLKDVIIIMTSNVGVAEAANRGNVIGFGTSNYDMSKEIIEKELKKKFKPEFLNRIQKIVYFNKLNDENLHSIIKLEIGKLNEKVEKMGYKLSKDITEGEMVERIHNSIKEKKDFGARPIVNEVQRMVEDKIVDYLIDNDVEEGFEFSIDNL